MSLITSIKLRILSTLTSDLDLQTRSSSVNTTDLFSWASGTGADQANQLLSDQRTLAASTSEDIDLGALMLDAYGSAVTFTKIKALIIKAAAGNTNDVEVGGASANQLVSLFGDASDKVKVKPGGLIAWIAPDANGYAVTSGSADLLKIANGGAGTPVTYDIIVIGVQ